MTGVIAYPVADPFVLYLHRGLRYPGREGRALAVAVAVGAAAMAAAAAAAAVMAAGPVTHHVAAGANWELPGSVSS